MRIRSQSAATVLILATAATAKPLDSATWLVDLGRDYPRTPQAGLGDPDAEITLLFMQAASRVNPDLAEAYLWQYDMLVALDRTDAARDALGAYVRLQPDDIAAHLNWVALEIDRLQTAEARAEFCEKHLRQPSLPDNVASDLHRRLAEFHLGRGERDKAANEAQAAIKAYDLNFAARQLLAGIRAPASSPAEPRADLGEILLAVSASPNDADLARVAATRLMEVNLPEPAERLYAHAVALLRILDPNNALAQAMTDHALSLSVLGRDKEANEQLDMAGQQWKRLLAGAQGSLDPGLTAEMAWFYAFHRPEPAQAERLARVALAEVPDSVVARRALGSALRQLGRLDEAKTELAPIAGQDVAAAAEYVQMLAASKDGKAAGQELNRATTRPADPTGQRALVLASKAVGTQAPASRPAPPEARQAIQQFPWPVLDYPLHPDKYVSLKMVVPQAEMSPGEPWLMTARLTNIGPFPVTVGPGMMISPDLLVSVTTEGDRPRTTGPTLRFSLNRTPRLMPGEFVEVTHTIDVGVIRAGMIGTPQMTQEVTVNGVLSPITVVNDQGREMVAPDIGGLLAEPLKFRRAAIIPNEDRLNDLMAHLRSADPMARIHSLEVLSMLLAEQQHIQAGRLDYVHRPVDAAAVQAAILGMAADPDVSVRARLAECLRWFGLDKAATNTATSLLSDPNWLVRGLAMRALTDHYGAKFQSVLSKAAQADPDDWVRRLTTALNARITAATTAPASQPAQ